MGERNPVAMTGAYLLFYAMFGCLAITSVVGVVLIRIFGG